MELRQPVCQTEECSSSQTVSKGFHIVLDIYCQSPRYPNNKDSCLEKLVEEIIERFSFTCKGSLKYEFSPCGVTLLYLLTESHVSVHTWPEDNFIAMDIYTCKSPPCRESILSFADKIVAFIEDKVDVLYMRISFIKRG